jgi:peptidoglycan/LPS O-acetylase OafA/YrhL
MLRPDIQGLRGIAVLLVVLYHAGLPWLPGGYVGVDVFFVISGYLITGLLVREVQAQGRAHLLNFLARRARRLLPAAIVLVAVVACAAVWLYPPLERTDIIAAARAASLYGANLWFAFSAVDYLGGHAAVNPMLHMWSLGVEEQFYLLWPLMVSLAAARRWAGDATRRVVWMVVTVTAVTFVACLWMTRYSQPWAFFGTPFRAWEFGLGALVVLMRPRLLAAPPAWIGIAGWVGAAAIVASALALDHRSPFPGPWALLPVTGTALVLAALQPGGPKALRAALAFRPLARVGDVSYSWYLWHWPLIVIVPVLYPQGGTAAVALAVALSYLAAEASYRWIEQPFRTGRGARAVPRQAVSAALATTVLTAGALTLLHERAQNAPISAAQQSYIAARKDIAAVYAPG